MATAPKIPICRPVSLPKHLLLHSAHVAVATNPQNAPMLGTADSLVQPTPESIAIFTSKRWQNGTTLTVNFMEAIAPDLRNVILTYMNKWSARVNVKFVYSTVNPVVRVTLAGDGYYSFVGTDALSIPTSEPTFCLQDWSLDMPVSECLRVIQHEAGHVLGSVHEHARAAVVALLDPTRTISYFEQTQGWSQQMIMDQILTPLDESDLTGTTPSEVSIMCYQFDGSCTKDGNPIPGGVDITEDDFKLMSSVYPLPSTPVPIPVPSPPPTTPPPGGGIPIALGGPAVRGVAGPGAPLVLALTLPGPATFAAIVLTTGRGLFARPRPQVTLVVTGPSGHTTPVPIRMGVASLAARTGGLSTLTFASTLPTPLTVNLVAD